MDLITITAKGVIEFEVRPAPKLPGVAMRFRLAHKEPGMEGDWGSWITIDPEGAKRLTETIADAIRELPPAIPR